jgi:hypothetical protein
VSETLAAAIQPATSGPRLHVVCEIESMPSMVHPHGRREHQG